MTRYLSTGAAGLVQVARKEWWVTSEVIRSVGASNIISEREQTGAGIRSDMSSISHCEPCHHKSALTAFAPLTKKPLAHEKNVFLRLFCKSFLCFLLKLIYTQEVLSKKVSDAWIQLPLMFQNNRNCRAESSRNLSTSLSHRQPRQADLLFSVFKSRIDLGRTEHVILIWGLQ